MVAAGRSSRSSRLAPTTRGVPGSRRDTTTSRHIGVRVAVEAVPTGIRRRVSTGTKTGRTTH